MKGFLAATVAFAAAYVLLQNGTSSKITSAGGVLTTALTRFLSPTAAGIGNHSGTTTSTTTGASSTGGTGTVYTA